MPVILHLFQNFVQRAQTSKSLLKYMNIKNFHVNKDCTFW